MIFFVKLSMGVIVVTVTSEESLAGYYGQAWYDMVSFSSSFKVVTGSVPGAEWCVSGCSGRVCELYACVSDSRKRIGWVRPPSPIGSSLKRRRLWLAGQAGLLYKSAFRMCCQWRDFCV